MKTKSIVYCFVLALGFLGAQTASAADGPTTTQNLNLTVSGSALLSVTGGTVGLSLTGATQAGAEVTPIAENQASRLKISSLSGGGTTGRSITASVTTGTLVGKRTSLSVQLLPPTVASRDNFINYATEGGALGALQVVADNAAVAGAITLVTGIKTCWSGILPDDGYQIKYKYMSTGGGTPLAASLTVTYTIGDDL